MKVTAKDKKSISQLPTITLVMSSLSLMGSSSTVAEQSTLNGKFEGSNPPMWPFSQWQYKKRLLSRINASLLLLI
jgi:hypothetical protein